MTTARTLVYERRRHEDQPQHRYSAVEIQQQQPQQQKQQHLACTHTARIHVDACSAGYTLQCNRQQLLTTKTANAAANIFSCRVWGERFYFFMSFCPQYFLLQLDNANALNLGYMRVCAARLQDQTS